METFWPNSLPLFPDFTISSGWVEAEGIHIYIYERIAKGNTMTVRSIYILAHKEPIEHHRPLNSNTFYTHLCVCVYTIQI